MSWTYGAEHELADWDARLPLPPGLTHNRKDYTIVNSNGVANDPKLKTYPYGGEINTDPTPTMGGQVELLQLIKARVPGATVNYRSNLHLHIRVPGLSEDLKALQRVQAFIHEHLPSFFQEMLLLDKPSRAEGQSEEEHAGAVRRWRRNRVSQQTLLTPKRLSAQLEATTLDEFFEAEAPMGRNGRPQWQFQPRLAINLRQLRETDTVEFRCFFGTMEERRLRFALQFCDDFLCAAISGQPGEKLVELYRSRRQLWPLRPPYNHRLDQGFRATTHDHSVKRADIIANTRRILEGEFFND